MNITVVGGGNVGTLIAGQLTLKGNKVTIYTRDVSKWSNEITILDVLKTENPDYAEEIYKNDNIKLLRKYLNVLTKREREVLTKRYGLDNTDEITQKEIAKELGISRSYVSRIEKRAITKILREFIRNDSSTK